MSETQFMTSIQADFGDEDSKYYLWSILATSGCNLPHAGCISYDLLTHCEQHTYCIHSNPFLAAVQESRHERIAAQPYLDDRKLTRKEPYEPA
jgi:hypothetical protein